MTNAQVVILIAMIVYLIGMLLIGFAVSKKNETVSDFYLGGGVYTQLACSIATILAGLMAAGLRQLM